MLMLDSDTTADIVKRINGPRMCADGEPGWFFWSKVMADDKRLTKVVKVVELILFMTLVGVGHE
jgi:hypothetical protein